MIANRARYRQTQMIFADRRILPKTAQIEDKPTENGNRNQTNRN